MKFFNLKKMLIKEAITIFIILLITGGIFYGAIFWEGGLEKDLNSIKAEIRNINAQEISEKKGYEALVDAIESYAKIPERRLPTAEGMNKYSSRIRISTPIIESLKNKYRLTKLNISFTAVELEQKRRRFKEIKVLSNNLTVDFEGMSDELILSFTEAIIGEFPGYLIMNRLEINRSEGITSDILDSMRDGGELIPLVKGAMVFEWKTLQGNTVVIKERGGIDNEGEVEEKDE